MNIAIVGAGINGLSTALELANDGHQVTVYEQTQTAAEEASFAPGGWLYPSTAPSLSAPGSGMPFSALQKNKDLFQTTGLLGSPAWRWIRQWKKNEKAALQQETPDPIRALHSLSLYSQSLRSSNHESLEAASERKTGALVMLRTPQEASLWTAQLQQLHAYGVQAQWLDTAQAYALEPGIGSEAPWLQALHFPHGESINPRLWAQQMRQQALERGVYIHTGHQVHALSTQPLGVLVNHSLHPHEAVVLCTGGSTSLLTSIGLQLPHIQAWGYSITTPVRDAMLAPRSIIMDWSQQATISRMGQRIRITAGIELGSTAQAPHHEACLQRMYQLLNMWFPGGAQLTSSQVQVWRGCRTILPDGLPALGASHHHGIWLNLAHGSHGVALASGCARALADCISQRQPAVDMQAFNPLRFR